MTSRTTPSPVPTLLLTVAVTLASTLLAARPAAATGGTTYHVSTSGSDVGPGTTTSPFRTIQRCATVMVAGDTCQIAAGTYRETITPAANGTATNRITYTAAPGARVVVDGSDPVTGWSAVTPANLTTLQASDPTITGSEFASAVGAGHVHRAPVTVNGNLPGQQVFVDDAMQPEAAWPHAGNNPAEPILASAQSGTQTSLSDPALTQPAGWWVGARLTSHNWFVSETGTVTSSAVGSVTASSLPACVGLSPNQKNLYSLTGKLALLGKPGEWHHRPADGHLYLWTPDGATPSTHLVEVKKREYGLDLSGRSYLTVLGLGLKGTTIQTSSTTHHVVLDGIAARYVSAYADLTVDPNKVTPADPCDVLTAGETTSGIQLRGSGNTLRNSTVDWSAGNGVLVDGTGNVVSNNRITNANYLGSYAASINLLGSNHLISHNTAWGSGRSNLNIDNKVAGTTSSGHLIRYNDFGDYGKLVNDVGAIYVCCRVNLAGTVIDHNLLHDAAPGVAADGPAPGVYLDLETYNATVANNVAWNRTTYGVVLINPNGGTTSGNRIYGNTSGTDPKAVSLFGGTYSSSEVRNNIGTVDTAAGVTVTNNLPNSTNPQFVNPGALDFTVGAGSPARNAATPLPPWTDGSTDLSPTIGAYPYGAPKWAAGAWSSATVVPAESFVSGAGVNTRAAGTGTVVGSFDGGDWVRYANVAFGAGRTGFEVSIATEAAYAGQRFEIRIDASTGPVIGTATVSSTGSFNRFGTQYTPIVPTSGTHDVYLRALGSGPGVGDLDTIAFTRPPARFEAEAADASSGTTTTPGGTGSYVGSFDGGDTLTFRSVDFGGGRTSFVAAVAVDPAYAGQRIEVRLGSPSGTTIGTMTLTSTGSWARFATQTTAITPTSGMHDVFLVATGGAGVANLDWISFE
ncbi:carbohydrate-binding protein [Micromonospora sp. DH14]|uniref:carbohydrate-binding protein n=1 Tax=Micromonospora sp. DH14 TaxID=3040120 RepID=UPI002442F07B|nr:carbohydrate-binding protein [Micromonospora sp. DH14]MDG9674178.1 carbohydrate-binding protein [Micromonospora sp. DH14]